MTLVARRHPIQTPSNPGDRRFGLRMNRPFGVADVYVAEERDLVWVGLPTERIDGVEEGASLLKCLLRVGKNPRHEPEALLGCPFDCLMARSGDEHRRMRDLNRPRREGQLLHPEE